MIPFEKTKDPKAVEDLYAKKFEELPRHRMSEMDSRIMIGLIMTKADITDLRTLIGPAIITERMKSLGYTLDDKTAAFLGSICDSPGKCVMYSYYLAYWCKKNSVKHITFEQFCTDIFPVGFPSEEDLNTLWDQQKVKRFAEEDLPGMGTDNLLDYYTAAESIRNTETA
jgi:hypothetical protein